MKTTGTILCFGLIGLLTARAVEQGQSPAQVRSELGEPVGQLLSGARLIYTYDRGVVEFQSNAVVNCELVTREEAELRRVAQEVERARLAEWAAVQREARLARGQAALETVRADTAFGLRSPSEQVSFWRSFRQQYPEIPVDQEYATALKKQEVRTLEARAAAEEERRIADLERRLAEAEDRARDAERRSLLRPVAYEGLYSYSYPAIYYPVRVIQSCYRPRTCTPPPAPYCGRPGLSISLQGGSTVVRGNVALVRH